MTADEVTALVRGCERILITQQVDTESVSNFFAAFPMAGICRVLQEEGDDENSRIITRALTLILDSETGKQKLPDIAQYLVFALDHPSHVLRQLGCKYLGGYLLAYPQARNQKDIAGPLVAALADPDTGVSFQAQTALLHFAKDGAALKWLLSQQGCLSDLAVATASSDSLERLRTLSFLVDLSAASPDAALVVLNAGLLEPLIGELQNGDDLLTCMAALQLLKDIAERHAFPNAVVARLLPVLQAHLQPATDETLLCAALDAAAHLLAHRSTAAPAAAFLSTVQALVEGEETGNLVIESALDAAGSLCIAPHGAEALLASAPGLADFVAGMALGRAPTPQLRVTALHTLATAAGAESVNPDGSAGNAIRSPQAEQTLKSAVYIGAHPNAGAAAGPAQAVWELLSMPFAEYKVAVYRLCSALCLRTWFAAEVCQHKELLDHVVDPLSEGGLVAKWRFSVVLALSHTSTEAAKRASANNGGIDSIVGSFAERLGKSVLASPYGRGPSEKPFTGEAIPDVATTYR